MLSFEFLLVFLTGFFRRGKKLLLVVLHLLHWPYRVVVNGADVAEKELPL